MKSMREPTEEILRVCQHHMWNLVLLYSEVEYHNAFYPEVEPLLKSTHRMRGSNDIDAKVTCVHKYLELLVPYQTMTASLRLKLEFFTNEP